MATSSVTVTRWIALAAFGIAAIAAFAALRPGAATVPPTPARQIVSTVAPARLPVTYYLVDNEDQARGIRAMFSAVNQTRLANGEPPILVAVVDPSLDAADFGRLVNPDLGFLVTASSIDFRDLRNSCGSCPADDPW